ncbi:MAG: hypothetical protein QF723_05070, partial [Phycisphaerales bacterium]|nr:hypothetical protein [Phycisphaerales bacterium]
MSAVAGNAGQLVINSDGPVTIEASGDALVAVDESDLSTSILAAGETGRLGAGTGETLSSVDGHLDVTTGEPLRIEASLQNLRETASFTSEEIQIAINDVDQAILATTLTFDGPIVLEQSVSLSGDDRLTLQGGGVSGSESTALSLSTAGLFELEGDLGSESSTLGNINITALDDAIAVSLLGGHGRAGQNIHTSGDLSISGIEGTGSELVTSVAEAVVVRADGNIAIGAGGDDLSIQTTDDVDIEASGTLTNRGEFDIGGAMRLAGGDLTNTADISAEQGITMQALTGNLDTTGMLNTQMDINLAAANMLTNNVSLTSEQGSVRLESYTSDVVSHATLSAADTVSLTANAGSVSLTGEINASDVTMTADSGITISSDVTGTSAVTATTATGDITASGGGLLQGEALTLEATTGSIDATSNLTGQTIDVLAANDLTIAGNVTGQSAAASGSGDVALMAQSGDLEVAGNLEGAAITLTAGSGDVTYAGTVAATGLVDINASGGELSLSGDLTGASVIGHASEDGVVTASVTSTSGDVTLDAGGDLTVSGDIDSSASVDLSLLATSGGDLVIDVDVVQAETDLSVTANNGGSIQAAGNFEGGTLAFQGETITMSSGSLTGGTVDVTSIGSMDLAANITSTGGAVNVTSGGDMDLAANITSTGGTTLEASNDLTYAGEANAGDALSLSGETITVSSGSLTGGTVDVTSIGSMD